jgi:hypothetical protein
MLGSTTERVDALAAPDLVVHDAAPLPESGEQARAPTRRHRRLVRFSLGTLLVLQGLAHAAAGTWAAASISAWFVTPAWAAAMLGFMGAGFGIWGAAPLARRWQSLVVIGAVGSLLLLLLGTVGVPLFALGLAVDVALVLTVLERSPDENQRLARPPRFRSRAGAVLAMLCLGYVGATITLRPWHTRWGTSAAERLMPLPGDEVVPDARYRMDHAISIAAPPDSVWPWIAQLGQDRGGFYSYDWLERAFGDHVRNADRVYPEWQERRVGELVRAVQPGYLGVFDDELGWRVLQFDAPHALVLEGWGAFVVRPQPDGTTRLHVRLRGEGRPSVAGVVFGPVTLLVFEPAHFIMERAMLRGIAARAERMMGATRPSVQ